MIVVTSTNDDVIGLKKLEVQPVNYDEAPVILQHRYQLVCAAVKQTRLARTLYTKVIEKVSNSTQSPPVHQHPSTLLERP